MGSNSSTTNSENTDKENKIISPIFKQYKPEDFNELIEKIALLAQISKNRMFFKELDDASLDKFSKKYNQFIGMKRFCIPIIGGISCGKSTFLNYLLPYHNILEIGSKITTKFICIIRHSKNINIPEIYNVKIEQRDERAFNFIETGTNLLELENLDLSEMIKNKNNEVQEKENNIDYKINPENFFLIIKMKIPLFEGEYEKYGELIDFIDIPGLDEVKDIEIFDDYIKPIFYNILFPFFLFDIDRYTHTSSKRNLEQYLEYHYKMTNDDKDNYTKGFFILNKIDKLGKDNSLDDIVKDFKSIYNEIKLITRKIKIPFKAENKLKNSSDEFYNDFIPISAQKLIKEQRPLIDNIIDDIIQKSKDKDDLSFNKFKIDYFKKEYGLDISNIGIIDEKEKTIELKKELRLKNKYLKEECESLTNPKFTLEEYIYIKNNINKNKNNNDLLEDNLKEMIQKKIKYLIDDFLNFEFEDLYKKGSNLNSELIKEIKVDKIDPLKFIDEFNKKFNKFFPDTINKGFKKINELKSNYNDFENFRKNKKIRILFIGKISAGKTSLLNSIIGGNNKILQTSIKECTQAIFIIKYSDKISFCDSILKKNEFGNYFEDIEGTKIEEINKIEEKIKLINEKSYKEAKYYSLYMPIEGLKIGNKWNKEFDLIKKEYIELIDIPGFKDTKFEKQKYLKDLINLCDGFIFSFNGQTIIEDKDSQDFFSNIIQYIKEKDGSFNFNNCLFNINYIDLLKKNEIDDLVKRFKEVIYNIINGNIYKGNLIEKIKLKSKIKESQNINISYFSNKKYNSFLKNISDIKNLKFLEDSNNKNLDDIYSELKEDYEQIPILNNIDQKKISEKINEILKKMKINNNDISNHDSLQLKKIAILILSILENKEQLKSYKLSYADIFFKEFIEQIIVSDKNNRQFIIQKSLSFIIFTLFKLYYIDNLCMNKDILKENLKKIDKIKEKIEKECQNYIDIINNNFSYILEEKINDMEKDINRIANLRGFLSKQGIMKIIEENKIIDNINYIIEEQKIGWLEQINNFGEFCISQCSNIIEDKNYKIISGILLLNFEEDYKDKFFQNSSSPLFNNFTSKKILKIYIGTIFFFVSIPILFYEKYKSNAKKISDIFNEIKELFEKMKKKIIFEYEKQRNNFLNKLNDIEQITSKEIDFLKKMIFKIISKT